MEVIQFGDLTRRLSEAGAARRSVLRAAGTMLLGGVFAGLAAQLGLADDTAAKGKQHKANPKQKRTPQAERQAHR